MMDADDGGRWLVEPPPTLIGAPVRSSGTKRLAVPGMVDDEPAFEPVRPMATRRSSSSAAPPGTPNGDEYAASASCTTDTALLSSSREVSVVRNGIEAGEGEGDMATTDDDADVGVGCRRSDDDAVDAC